MDNKKKLIIKRMKDAAFAKGWKQGFNYCFKSYDIDFCTNMKNKLVKALDDTASEGYNMGYEAGYKRGEKETYINALMKFRGFSYYEAIIYTRYNGIDL